MEGIHSETAREPLPYMRQLDGLRAVAIGGVLLQHLLEGSAKIFPAGAIGVRVFFVLSGFLITGILLRMRPDEGGTSVRRALRTFYVRRFLRIFPLFYLALFVVAVLDIAGVRERLWWHVLYVSNYFLAVRGNTAVTEAHLWSLSVEEQFYLLWPALVFLTPRRFLPHAILATIAVGPLYRLGVSIPRWHGPAVWAPTPACLDSLGAGALLALCADPKSNVARHRAALVSVCRRVGIPLLLVVLVMHGLDRFAGFRRIFLDFSVAMVSVALIDAASRGITGVFGRLLSAKPVVFVGIISYGLYVWHPFVAFYVRERLCPQADFGNPRFYLAAGVTLIVSFVLAAVSWLAYERPINRLKRYFDYN